MTNGGTGLRIWNTSNTRRMLILGDVDVALFVNSVGVDGGGNALFATRNSLAPFITGDQVITSNFGTYSNTTYYYRNVTATIFTLHTTRQGALDNNNTVASLGTDTGTVSIQS